jgi:hypothetical protein
VTMPSTTLGIYYKNNEKQKNNREENSWVSSTSFIFKNIKINTLF